MNIDEAIQLALKHQQVGSLLQAESIYKEILKVQPNNVNALHFLGLLFYQRKEYKFAIAHIKEALQYAPTYADAYNNLGIVLQHIGDLDEAVVCYKKAIELNPEFEGAYRNLSAATEDTASIINTPLREPISLCMIVKDEENSITRCLSNIRSVVDEMIVVDTGSIDGTKEIARALGAKVYDFQWTNNFADARNFSLSHATGKWILVLDADEVISPVDLDNLKDTLQKTTSNFVAFSFIRRNYVTEVNTSGWTANNGYYPKEEAGTGWFTHKIVRLFPNDHRIRFENRIHENIVPSLLSLGIEVKECEVTIHHYGMLKEDKLTSKYEYYYDLSKIRLAEKGENDFKALYELAVQASGLKKYEEALVYLEKAIRIAPADPHPFESMGNAYYNLCRYEDAKSSYKKTLELDPNSKEACLMYATSEIYTENAKVAIPFLDKLLQKYPTDVRIILTLAIAHICAKEKDKGIKYIADLKNMNVNCKDLLTNIAKILLNVKKFSYAISILNAAIESNDINNETFVLLADCDNEMQ